MKSSGGGTTDEQPKPDWCTGVVSGQQVPFAAIIIERMAMRRGGAQHLIAT